MNPVPKSGAPGLDAPVKCESGVPKAPVTTSKEVLASRP